jgi:hypothetical protein
MTYQHITGGAAACPWSASGRFLPVVTNRNQPILLKKSRFFNRRKIGRRNLLLARLYVKSQPENLGRSTTHTFLPWKPRPTVFNRIDPKLSVAENTDVLKQRQLVKLFGNDFATGRGVQLPDSVA